MMKLQKGGQCKNGSINPCYALHSNPKGYRVNAKRLDSDHWHKWPIENFEGQNWQTNASSLVHLSQHY